jgi:uncharacterized protein YhhL (DUF1145 family)
VNYSFNTNADYSLLVRLTILVSLEATELLLLRSTLISAGSLGAPAKRHFDLTHAQLP